MLDGFLGIPREEGVELLSPDGHSLCLGDMAGLAKEAATPSNQRDRPYERLLGEETLAVFKEWWDKANPDIL